jgi:hypothetical protein
MEEKHGYLSTGRHRASIGADHRVRMPVRFMYVSAAIALLCAVGVSLLSKEADMSGHVGTLVRILHIGAIGCWVVAGVAWGLASSMALVHMLVQWLLPPRGTP